MRALDRDEHAAGASPAAPQADRAPAGQPARARHALAFALLGGLLLASCAAGVLAGPSSAGLPELVALATGGDLPDNVRAILENVRIPRVCAGALAGGALAVAGAIIQAVLRNPLASPNILGINAGAGLAVLLCSAAAPGLYQLLPLAAFAGAMACAAIVFLISLKAGAGNLTVVLAGMALTAIFTAGMNTVLIVDPDAYVGSSRFLVGGLSGVQMSSLCWPAAYIAAGIALAFCLVRKLNALALGDETAHSLGIDVNRTRLLALAVAAVLAGAAVSFAGLVGFVGLVVPHIVRLVLGGDNRVVIPASLLAGSAFVVACDLAARVAFAPYELPVGILMAFVGGPFFIYLIVRTRGGRG